MTLGRLQPHIGFNPWNFHIPWMWQKKGWGEVGTRRDSNTWLMFTSSHCLRLRQMASSSWNSSWKSDYNLYSLYSFYRPTRRMMTWLSLGCPNLQCLLHPTLMDPSPTPSWWVISQGRWGSSIGNSIPCGEGISMWLWREAITTRIQGGTKWIKSKGEQIGKQIW